MPKGEKSCAKYGWVDLRGAAMYVLVENDFHPQIPSSPSEPMSGRTSRFTRIALAIALFYAPTMLLAQHTTLQGTVRDASTGAPLPGTEIRVSGSRVATLSDGQGRFRIDAPAGAAIEANRIGYATQRSVATAGATGPVRLDFLLSASAVPMDGLVVTASGSDQSVMYAPATIGVVPRADLARGQVRNLSEAIQTLPGVDIDGADARSNKTGNRTISLRGLPSEYTLILIDGRRQNVPGTVAPNAFNDAAAAFLPPVAAIERIEVVRGPMSTLYGSDALGGVVNVITRGTYSSWTAEASVDGTVNTQRAFGRSGSVEGFVAGPLIADRLSVQFQARRYERTETTVEFPGQDVSVDRRRTMGQLPTEGTIGTAGARLTFTPAPRHDLYLGSDRTRQRYDNTFGQLGQINVSAAVGSAAFPDRLAGYDRDLGFERDQIYLGHRARFSRALVHTTLSSNRTETTGRTIPSAAASVASGRRGAPRALETRARTADTRMTAFLGANTMTAGAEYIDARLTDGIPDRTFTSEQLGFFAENEWRVTRRVRLTGGLRWDDHSGFGGQFSPRAYGVLAASPEWTLKGGVARGYRAPALEQLDAGIIGFGNQGRDPLYGNPDLRPELSTNYEVGAIHDRDGELTMGATAFRTDISDKIERPSGAGSAVTANIGTAVLQGLEFTAGARFARDWYFRTDYTWTRSEVTTSGVHGITQGDPLFGVPAHMLNSRLRWQATRALEATLAGQFRSKRYRPDNFHEPHLGGSAQGAAEALGDFHAYHLLSLGADYRINDRLRLNAVVENLLNHDFVDYRPYTLRNNPSVTAYSNVYNNIHEPRRLWVSVRATM